MFWNGFPVAVLLLAPLGVPVPIHHHVTRLEKMTDQAAVAQFTDAVNRYMNLRWMVEEPLAPEGLCSDPEEAQRGVERLARAIRAERAAARAGDIFSPAVASLFRQHITAARYELGAEVATYLEDAEVQELHRVAPSRSQSVASMEHGRRVMAIPPSEAATSAA